ELLHEDAARADLAERLRAVAVAGCRDRDERMLDPRRMQPRSGELRLREREPTAATADADQHSASACAPADRRSSRRGDAPARTPSGPAAAAAGPSACRPSAFVL